MVPPSAWAADETPAPAKANRATRAARNPDENRMIPPVSLDDSQTGIGGADFDETMTDQLGDLAAGFADAVIRGYEPKTSDTETRPGTEVGVTFPQRSKFIIG